jgi:hypothetical protein
MVWRSVRTGGDTKTGKSRRTLELPQRCVDAHLFHCERQGQLRERAGERWHDNELVLPRAWVPLSTQGMSAARSARSPPQRALTLPTGRRASCGIASSRCCPTRVSLSRRSPALSATPEPPRRRPSTATKSGPWSPVALRSWPVSWWRYQDLNLGPLPYQVSSATRLTWVKRGCDTCGVVREWPL